MCCFVVLPGRFSSIHNKDEGQSCPDTVIRQRQVTDDPCTIRVHSWLLFPAPWPLPLLRKHHLPHRPQQSHTIHPRLRSYLKVGTSVRCSSRAGAVKSLSPDFSTSRAASFPRQKTVPLPSAPDKSRLRPADHAHPSRPTYPDNTPPPASPVAAPIR